MMALKMKTVKGADFELALKKTVVTVHDMFQLCMLFFLHNLLT